MAVVGRYEADRTEVVNDANTIGTVYPQAQTLPEPRPTQSLLLLRPSTDCRQALSRAVPGTAGLAMAVADANTIQNQLWGLAGTAVDTPLAPPPGSTSRTLNDMTDMHDPDLGTGEPGCPARWSTYIWSAALSPSIFWPSTWGCCTAR